MFRDEALKPKLASLAEQVRSDLSLLKGTEENPFGPACQKPFEVGFPHRQWRPAKVVAVHGEHVEGAECSRGAQQVSVDNLDCYFVLW